MKVSEFKKKIKDQIATFKVQGDKVTNLTLDNDGKLSFDYKIENDTSPLAFSVIFDDQDTTSAIVALDDEHMESIQVPASQNADLGKLFGKIIKQKVCENLLDKLAAEAEEESEEEEEVDDDGDYIMSQPDGFGTEDSFSIPKEEYEQHKNELIKDIEKANKACGSQKIFASYQESFFCVRFKLDTSFLDKISQEALGLVPNLSLIAEIEMPWEYISSHEAPKIGNSGIYQATDKPSILSSTSGVDKKNSDQFLLINWFLKNRLTTALKKNWIMHRTSNGGSKSNQILKKEAEDLVVVDADPYFATSSEEKTLVDLGFSPKVAYYALQEYSNDPNLAADRLWGDLALVEKFSRKADPRILKEKNIKTKENLDVYGNFNTNLSFSEEFEDLFSAKNKGNVLLGILNYLQEKLKTCSSTCIICDKKLGFSGLKPTVCDKELCIHSLYEHGLGIDLVNEIKNNGKVVDLLISFCYSALMMKKNGRKVLEPYPVQLTCNEQPMTDEGLEKLLDNIPSIDEMKKKAGSLQQLRDYLTTIHADIFPLLRWIISSNRSHLAVAPESMRIKGLENCQQFILLSSTPEKEAIFREKKKHLGSFYAFHGSAIGNWHCILRKGLKNYSNTEFMSAGAAAGPGIYLAHDLSTSSGYSLNTGYPTWKNSEHNGDACCSVVEVLDALNQPNPGLKVQGFGWTVQDEALVATRIFLVGKQFPQISSKTIHLNTPSE